MWNHVTSQNIEPPDLPAADDADGWAEYLPQTPWAQNEYRRLLADDVPFTPMEAVVAVLASLANGGGSDAD